MKEIKLAYDNGSVKKTITCFAPESWDEVLLKQYVEIQKVLADEGLSKLEKGMTRAAILTNVDLPTLEQCNMDEVLSLMGELSFSTIEPVPNLGKVITDITIAGKKYHAVTLFSMADLTAYDKIESAEGLPTIEKLGLKLAIFLRQELPKKWYQKLQLWKQNSEEKPKMEAFAGDAELVAHRKKLFTDNLTVAQVANLSAFFLKAVVESQLPTQDFGPLAQALLRQNKKMEQLFGRVMAGNQPSGLFQRILWKMKQWHSSQSAKFFRGSNTTKL
jgi:hypothetical protein